MGFRAVTAVIDTGVLYAHHDADAERHDYAKRALTRVLRGEYGQPYVTDYVYDESVTLTRYRMNSFEEAKTVSDRILETETLRLVHVRDFFDEAVEAFEEYSDQSLSFTDATTVALVQERGIDYVLSFDEDFDGIVDRLGPEAMEN